MIKRKFIFILFTTLVLTVLSSCRKDPIKEKSIRNETINEETINEETINEETINEETINEETIIEQESKDNIKRWSELESLEDIKEDMIIDNSIGSLSLVSLSTPKTSGFSLEFKGFTGVSHYVSISTIEECDVNISIKSSDSNKDFKAYLILSNGELIELMKDSSVEEISYSLMQGENIVALVGYKATGTFDIYIEPQEGVEITQID